MMLRRVLIPLLAGVFLALTPLAQTSPPDQTWIAGFYDNADYDDIILRIAGELSTVSCSPLSALAPVAVVIGFPSTTFDGAVLEPLRPSDLGRAPPLS